MNIFLGRTCLLFYNNFYFPRIIHKTCFVVLPKFLRPFPDSVFECHNPQGIKFLTRLHLSLSHLCEHKFKHSFQNLLNPLCNYDAEVESASHFLLHCPIYNNGPSSVPSIIRNIDCKWLKIINSSLTQTLLYGNPSIDIITNSFILKCYYWLILFTKRFEETLF